MKKRAFLSILILVMGLFLAVGLVLAGPLDLSEGFDDINNLPGWFSQNNSSPLGLTGWFQGNDTVFPAHSGASTSYLGANFNNTAGTGTISNWMLTPVLSLNDGDEVRFWTRTASGSIWPDRLQLRLSTNGASTNVGTLATDVGDFTNLLLDINPTYTTGGYPEAWTEFVVTVSGVGTTGVDGRLAFRYFVENGGPTGSNSNYIGIDTFSFTDVIVANPAITLEKTVGFDPAVCAPTSAVTVTIPYASSNPVYYCYTVTNTGDITLTVHDLVDSELGTLLDGLSYDLGPGESVDTVSAGLTFSATITETPTTNDATWTACNPTPGDGQGCINGTDVVTATASATVNLAAPTDVSLSGFAAAASNPVWPVVLVVGLVVGLGLAIRRKMMA